MLILVGVRLGDVASSFSLSEDFVIVGVADVLEACIYQNARD